MRLMFYMSLLLSLLLIQGASSKDLNDWEKIASSVDGTNFFIDKNSIKKSDKIRYFSLLIDLTEPVNGILSVKEYRQVNCDSGKFKSLKRNAYSDSLGRGSEHLASLWSNIGVSLGFENDFGEESAWKKAKQGTMNQASVDYVCQGPALYNLNKWTGGLLKALGQD
jgi:hypothetical protein